jgi:hypothetical protein
MKTCLRIAAVFASWFVIAGAASQPYYKELITISGTVQQVIEAAMPRFKQQRLPLDQYEITVLETSKSFVVIFDVPSDGKQSRGSPGPLPAYEVELDKKSLKVRCANISK